MASGPMKPTQVVYGSNMGNGVKPYMPQTPPKQQQPSSYTVGPNAVRATGSGPFDAQYRQNLATYAGGLFQNNGMMSFNPTNPATFPGQPTGGGTAPVSGMPNTLLSQALGGQPFSWMPPTPTSTPSGSGNLQSQGSNNWWLQQMLGQGQMFGIPGLNVAQGNQNA
jgi:hypothetical protein